MRERIFAFFYRNRFAIDEAGIPGPTPRFPGGTIADFMGKWTWEACADYGRKFGGMSVAWFMGTPAVVLNDPTLIGQVLDTDAASYYKDAPKDAGCSRDFTGAICSSRMVRAGKHYCVAALPRVSGNRSGLALPAGAGNPNCCEECTLDRLDRPDCWRID